MNQHSAGVRHGEAPELVERVRAYRSAARMAVEAPRDLRVRLLALIDLMRAARREEDRILRCWTERVIYEEARPLLEGGDPPAAVAGDPYERRARALRAEGYSRCPRCLAELPTDLDLARWAGMRRAEIERLEVRERAVRSS